VWFERSDKWRREDVGTAASNELRSPGSRPEFRFLNGLYIAYLPQVSRGDVTVLSSSSSSSEHLLLLLLSGGE